MKVLVIGSGGREHALCWHLRTRSSASEVFCAPGSAGISTVADLVDIPVDETQRLADFAAEIGIDVTIVGPELPLSLGVVDDFQERGLRIFGPRREAALLETSKVFAKEFMLRHDIPTAEFEVAHDRDEVLAAAKSFGFPVVLKADGLASGKGVFVVSSREELNDACQTFFEWRSFGGSSDRVIVEQFLVGEEVSFLALCDGQQFLPLATSKDYKRIGDGDRGPNTGGMGAHSPSGVVSTEVGREVMDRILGRTVAGMAAEGQPYVGVLYAGVVLTSRGPRVLEFNARFGDPEAQALLLRLDEDLATLLHAGARGDFGVSRLRFRKQAAACLVLAGAGYPGTPLKGDVIEGLDVAAGHEGVTVFHAATRWEGDSWKTAGGRVLNVCAVGETLREALRRAYGAAEQVTWAGRQLRSDIGRRVVSGPALLQSGVIDLPLR